MIRKCVKRHPILRPDSCAICRGFVPQTPNFRHEPPRRELLTLLPCVHLGEPTGETRECKTCGGSVKLKLLTCEIHGLCTVARRVDGVACCNGCKDHTPR